LPLEASWFQIRSIGWICSGGGAHVTLTLTFERLIGDYLHVAIVSVFLKVASPGGGLSKHLHGTIVGS
jgi:hypothetical protein